jgi:hypothetical protein
VKAHSTSLHVNMLRFQICIFCFASGMINSHALIKCVLGSETFGISKFAFVFCFSLAL